MKSARLVLAALLAAGGLAGCQEAPASGTAPRPPSGEVWLSQQEVRESGIAVAAVGERQVGNAVVTSGRIAFDDTRVAHVYSPVTGRVVDIVAPLGARVPKGAPLAVIDSPDVGAAHADFLKAETDLTAAGRELRRQRELVDAHAAAQRDLEAAQNGFDRARAEFERARQKMRTLRLPESDTVAATYTLRTPIAGEVIARTVNPGTEVQGQYSGGGAVELYTVGELDRVWALADVYEVDLARVERGAPVTVTVVSRPGKAFTGSVDWVSDALDPATHTAKVRCTIDNPERDLRAEMFATVVIALGGRRALALPREAVLRLSDQAVVFVERGEAPGGLVRFEKRTVTLDDQGGGAFVPVVSGLASGERVVTSGAILLAGAL